MTKLAGVGRVAAAAIFISGIAFGTLAKADEVSEEQMQAARATITALGVTNQFDSILPNLAEQLKSQLIQASPNFQDLISATVDEKALELATRRGDLEKEAATIYARAFSLEELKAIAAFYGSEPGKKLLKDGPIATRELLRAADIWAAGMSRDLARESDAALEKQIGAKIEAEGAQPAAPEAQ
ncbi:DUF2059 domain-containing protein [Rhizobiaceae bacterium n13]|uniref:DUF2059 domain-containing protein n=1 Tax=Ferirhizobium litorale TaxID=2927786 RepID=A0AAE3QFX3_9HYPH|nr:DUF2059 domain-containing protein [Fererhizobium litorale]MDI7863867.1 DUF2059 domain-containing protein [Fererhizobium litorale]MDI7924301.1 DUF2059 domain-containing protein [Fererhizobium litorale]